VVPERLLLICIVSLVLCINVAQGEGNYQSTRDRKTLVWNSHPDPGDVATWSGGRDRDGFARGFGQLVWYTKEPGFDKPQLYARYWGRMVDGRLEGPVNVHSKRKTDYAIFIDGARVTGWMAGTAPSRATPRWSMMVAERRTNVEPAEAEEPRRAEPEPESPAAGPVLEKEEGGGQRSEDRRQNTGPPESIEDFYSERWPKIDIDDSLRLLAFPPRSLRWR
jgi:hypothetical protein